MTDRLQKILQHLVLSEKNNTEEDEQKQKILQNDAASFFRETTVMEPNLMDEDRKKLPCKSLNEREAWLRYFISTKPGKDEMDYFVDNNEIIQGTIPSWLDGSFFRNGPGLFELGGERIHMADGDGLIVKVSFRGGRAHVKSKFVETPEFKEEQQAGRITFRPSYANSNVQGSSSFDHLRKNIANLEWKTLGNTNQLDWGGKFAVLHEVGLPILMDPKTLETIGEWTIDGVLKPREAFSAHHRIDTDKKRLLNFGIGYRSGGNGILPMMNFYEFDELFKLVQKHEFPMKGQTTAHSFVATPNYFVMMVPPIRAKLLGVAYFLGWGVDEVLEHDREGKCFIFVIPRNPTRIGKDGINRMATVYRCVNWWPNHHASAWETPEGDIYMDSCMYEYKTKAWIERGPFDLAPTHMVRYFIPHSKHKDNFNQDNYYDTDLYANHEIIYAKDCEMPILNPLFDLKPHRYTYLVDMQCKKMPNKIADQQKISRKFGQAFEVTPWTGIIKYDLYNNTLQGPIFPGGFCGEVCFIPRPNAIEEDDGILAHLLFDPVELKSYLVMREAQDISKVICKILFRKPIPFSFHCSFTKFYGPDSMTD